ncbi:unnamed protein product, partial [Effrenium voratum]
GPAMSDDTGPSASRLSPAAWRQKLLDASEACAVWYFEAHLGAEKVAQQLPPGR